MQRFEIDDFGDFVCKTSGHHGHDFTLPNRRGSSPNLLDRPGNDIFSNGIPRVDSSSTRCAKPAKEKSTQMRNSRGEGISSAFSARSRAEAIGSHITSTLYANGI